MAKLRKFCAYRRLERPYTRTSRYRKKSFIRVRPHSKIVKYNMGDSKKKFDVTFDLISKGDLQIRHNAIESARLTCNRYLEKNLGKGGFYFEIRAFPHHILRENPLASGAGADRMSTGMKMSFGKPIGVAAQIRIGAPILSVSVTKNQMKVGREAVKKSSKKLPGKFSIVERAFSQTKVAVVKEKPVKEGKTAKEETQVKEEAEPMEKTSEKVAVEKKKEQEEKKEVTPVEDAIEKKAESEVKVEEKPKAEVS